MALGQYAAQTLNMDAGAFSSPTVATQVLLCHLDSLWGLLISIISLWEIQAKYKADVSDVQKKRILAAASTFDDNFREIVLDFMCGHLKENATLNPKSTLMDTIGYKYIGDDLLNELPWFQDAFSDDILLENIVAVYRLLDK